jgi:hypothetical protein
MYLLIIYILQCHSFAFLIKTYRLINDVSEPLKKYEIILISSFSLLAPIFIANISNNFNLQAHFLLIYTIGLAISNYKYKCDFTFLLCILSLFFDAYISLMNLMCYVCLVYFNYKDTTYTYRYKYVLYIIIYIFILYQIGYIGNGTVPADCCWGRYGINILGWLDARGQDQTFNWSRIIGDIPGNNGWEAGFCFLGSVTIIAIFFQLKKFTAIISNFKIEFKIFLVALLLFSITNHINIGAISFRIPLFTDYIEKNLLSIFRGSGRFIWPINYLISGIAIIIILDLIKNMNTYKKYLIIILLISFQIFDSWSAISHIKSRFTYKSEPLNNELYNDCQILNCSFIGFASPKNYKDKYDIIAYTALKARVETNAVYLARYNHSEAITRINLIKNNICINSKNKFKYDNTAIIAYEKNLASKQVNINDCRLFTYNDLNEYVFVAYKIE